MLTSGSPHLSSSKFTRGEKCIFTHVVITFAGIVAIVIVYYGHACFVRHRGDRALALGRARASAAHAAPAPPPEPAAADPAYRCVGAAFVRVAGAGGERAACATAALRTRWSLAPARCVATRASPQLAHLLPHWTLRYDRHHTGVRRGTAHPLYEREGAAADVGLFEHEHALPLAEPDAAPLCAVPSGMLHQLMTSEAVELFIVGHQAEGGRSATAASALTAAQCAHLAAPVAPALASSVCLAPRAGTESHLPSPLLGAVVFDGSRLVGICSWGGGAGFPVVAARVAPFAYWLETSMKLL